ncbi:MAG TPA: phytanoyl-CoA dioxygenase family protein [Candidatus Binatia bacterium]|nr:phytanoyl-CoA dioxygenase family protein [Candidatus Binatia bacterium]
MPALSLPYRLRVQLTQARSRIERGVRRAVFGGRPSWKRRPDVLPWFDQPDALERIDGRGADPTVREKWVREGYVIVDACIDPADIDEMVGTIDGLWDAPEPIPDLTLLDLREAVDGETRNVLHRDLLALAPDCRRRMRQASDWRIHGFHYVNAAARRIYFDRQLAGLTSRLFGRHARPIAAINFMTGSEQDLHQDMAVFHIWPRNYLIGAWIACEDIADASGPLVFYPGSHRAPFFPGFNDYPQTNLRTADPDTARRYQAYVDDLATRFERREFKARKGQVLLWHGMLIHGGAPIARRGTSRKSMAIHYSVRGADRGREVEGPFNW